MLTITYVNWEAVEEMLKTANGQNRLFLLGLKILRAYPGATMSIRNKKRRRHRKPQ